MDFFSTILEYQSDVISSKDLYLTSLYYTVLKEKYYQTKDIEKYHHYSNLWEINNEVLIKEKICYMLKILKLH